MSTININGLEKELYYNLKAQRAITQRCGDLRKLKEWLQCDDVTLMLERICGVMADLINGAVYKNNCEIALGLKNGEKSTFIEDETLLCLVNPNRITEYSSSIWAAMGDGVDIPDDEEAPDTNSDPDLEEVESERKNEQGGAVTLPSA